MEPISRRHLLKLAAVSLLVLTGCTSFRRGSELAATHDELARLLEDISENYGRRVRLASVARRIEIRAGELVAEQREFLGSFDSLMSTREVTEVQLAQSIDAYSERRKWLRDDLLHLQDELHGALQPDEWTEVVKILNRGRRTVIRTSISGA
jgi:hypothetical protein